MGAFDDRFNSAQSAATGSLQQSRSALGLNVAGDALSGFGQMQQANYLAAVARNNASISNANAANALESGQYAGSLSRLQYGKLKGEQLAEQGASGIDAGVGSPLAVRQATQNMSDLDAAVIQANAERQAFGDRMQASTDTVSAKMLNRSALTAGALGINKAFSSYLSGSSAISSRAASLRLMGLDTNG